MVVFPAIEADIPCSAFPHSCAVLPKGILIGLEFLIVSDVFETVGKPVEERSIEDLIKLGSVVLIRTVIEYSLRE